MPRLPRRPLPDPYKVEIVLDSISPAGCRLTTWALTYPRFVHAELMTHRMFSRNSASSRAIPSEKMRRMIEEHPALPVFWGQNQSGMQARSELPSIEDLRRPIDIGPAIVVEVTPYEYVRSRWLQARDVMLRFSDELADLGKVHPDWAGIGLHKQLCNRLTEPWMPITVLVSATSFANWFHLRDHKDAQPEIQVIATEMHYQYLESRPQELAAGAWHLPYIREEDRNIVPWHAAANGGVLDDIGQETLLKKVSVGRCARVSYLTHEGKRDLEKDVELYDKLAATTQSEDPGHFSPFEHVAMALGRPERVGNFVGWRQYRKDFPNEAGPNEVSA